MPMRSPKGSNGFRGSEQDAVVVGLDAGAIGAWARACRVILCSSVDEQDEVVVAAARDQIVAAGAQEAPRRARVLSRSDGRSAGSSDWASRSDGEGSDGGVVRSTLQAREHGAIDGRGVVGVAQDQAAARSRAASCGVVVVDDPRRDPLARDARRQPPSPRWAISATRTSADAAGDLGKAGEVDDAHRGPAAEQQLWAGASGELFDLVQINATGVPCRTP